MLDQVNIDEEKSLRLAALKLPYIDSILSQEYGIDDYEFQRFNQERADKYLINLFLIVQNYDEVKHMLDKQLLKMGLIIRIIDKYIKSMRDDAEKTY